jgi:hypothetical protein
MCVYAGPLWHVPIPTLLKSRWYYKGPTGGVKNWTATPQAFPPGGEAGLVELHRELKWPLMAHNRW